MKSYGIGCFDGKLKWMTQEEVVAFNINKDPMAYEQAILHSHHNKHLVLQAVYPIPQGARLTTISITGMDEMDLYGDFVIQRCTYERGQSRSLPITVKYFNNYIKIKQTTQVWNGQRLPFTVETIAF
jgi:hypothetical protein